MNKKIGIVLTFFLSVFVFFSTNAGCRLCPKPWKRQQPSLSTSTSKNELPDISLYGGTPSDEMIEQVSYIRNGVPSENTKTQKLKKWYERPLLQSDRAEQISRNLGD